MQRTIRLSLFFIVTGTETEQAIEDRPNAMSKVKITYCTE